MEVGLHIKKKAGYSVVTFCSANVMDLELKQLPGKGYKQGDLLSIRILDASCTQWNFRTLENGIEINMSGSTEMDTISTLLRCAAEMIEKRCAGLSEEQVLDHVNTDFRSRYGASKEPDDLTETKHKIHLGKYKGLYLHEVDDLQYLKWFYDNVKLSTLFKEAVKIRIDNLSTLLK